MWWSEIDYKNVYLHAQAENNKFVYPLNGLKDADMA